MVGHDYIPRDANIVIEEIVEPFIEKFISVRLIDQGELTVARNGAEIDCVFLRFML
jgi:hypothetical protein